MHDFQYNFIKKNFNVELLFTDTDSLTCGGVIIDQFIGLKSKMY